MLGALSLLLSAGVHAAPIPVAPGRSVQVRPCLERPYARCWSRAQQLRRFATVSGIALEPADVDVRLATQDGHLLVRARGLRDDQAIELVLFAPGSKDLGTAQLIRARKGVSRHPLSNRQDKLLGRAATIQLWDESDAVMRKWAPVGSGELSRPATLWFSTKTDKAPEFTVDSEDAKWVVSAPPKAKITVTHRRALLPQGGRGVGDPWVRSGQSNQRFAAPPHTGWYDIEVQAGELLSTGAVYWTAPGSPMLSNLGIHPAPQTVEHVADQVFVLSDNVKICDETGALGIATEWLGAELTRLTGVQTTLSCDESPEPSIRLVLDKQKLPQAYAIESRETGITLTASGRRGAFYGAVAVADLIGLDGTAEPANIADRPRVLERLLYQEVSPQQGPMVRPEQVIAFIERVVARARFTTLVLELKGGIRTKSHPELARRDAWSMEDLDRVIQAAKRFDIEVIPAINAPGHANWITAAHPELSEENTPTLLCTRHPGTRALLTDLYTELHEAFGSPRFIHIGHDEIRWRTRWKHQVQRCPRCDGTPRWALLSEDLTWAHETVTRLGAKPMMWSDMLVKGWHGSWAGMYRAADELKEDIRADFHLISWGRTGDSVGTLVPKNYPVIRGNTGYADWKRVGLQDITRGIAGEALALFNASPWSSFQGGAGPTRDYHHWSNVILAGATAWKPEIEATPIDATLEILSSHPAYRPGYRAWPEGTSFHPATVRPDSSDTNDINLPLAIGVDSDSFPSRFMFTLNAGQSETFKMSGRRLAGVSLLQAVRYDPSLQNTLTLKDNKARPNGGIIVGSITTEFVDGSKEVAPLRLGMHTERMDRAGRGRLLFETAGQARLTSNSVGEFAPDAGDRTLYRFNWHNPQPSQPVHSLTLKAEQPGVEWIVAGMGTIRPKLTTHSDPDQ
jgi:hypothetical protein